jgi:hypothetical protein
VTERTPPRSWAFVCWSSWNGITARDGELLRRVATIERFFGKEKGLLTSPDWEPHTLEVQATPGGEVYGSRFPGKRGEGVVWFMINGLPTNTTATVALPGQYSSVCDCYAGHSALRKSGNVSVPIEASGIGCVYASQNLLDSKTKQFLRNIRNMTQGKPLQALSPAWHYLQQHVVSEGVAKADSHDGMVQIPALASFHFHAEEGKGSPFRGVNPQDGCVHRQPGGQGLPSYVSRQPYFQHMPRFLMHEGAQDGLTRRLAGTHLHLALENSGRGNRM